MAERINEDPGNIYSLMDEFLVVCPSCGKCARIARLHTDNVDWFAPRRLACSSCGYAKDWVGRELNLGWTDDPFDSYFGLPLWLKTPFRRHTLWAYNLRHLNLIEAYVAAKLREHHRDPKYGWSNRSWMNRLPTWITAGKNRDEVLRCIAKLRSSLLG